VSAPDSAAVAVSVSVPDAVSVTTSVSVPETASDFPDPQPALFNAIAVARSTAPIVLPHVFFIPSPLLVFRY
jgi:hypothetical protein